MANQFLVKETMAAMKALSAAEIDALEIGTYEGVQLLGYHEKGDTPAPIIYYLAPTTPDPRADDGGSIISAGTTKLLHTFDTAIDVRYFGLRSGAAYINDPQLVNNIFINNAGKSILFDYNTDFTMDMGIGWNDGTIKVVSNTKVIINGMIRHRPSTNGNASMFLVRNATNVSFEGTGTLIGYKHKRPVTGLTIYYQHFNRFNGNYQLGDYVTLNSYGYKVIQLGRMEKDPSVTTSSVIGDKFLLGMPSGPSEENQFMKLELIEEKLGEWGHGIYIYSSSNVHISDLTLREFWGDGSAVGGDEDQGNNKPSEMVKYHNVQFIDNRRQGLSLINCSTIEVDDCLFSQTYGTLPMAGIDLEPNPNKDGKIKVGKVIDVKITNSVFSDNYQALAMFNPFPLETSRIDHIYLENNEMRDNLISNLGVARAGNVTVTGLRSYPTKIGNYSGDVSVCAASFQMDNSYIQSDASYSTGQTNLHVINLSNTFTDLSLMKRFWVNNTELRGLNGVKLSFLNIPFACPDLDIKLDHVAVYDVGVCTVATGNTVTQLKSLAFENCYFRGYAGYLGSKNIVMEKLDYINNTFDLRSRPNVVNESLINVPVGCQLANIVGNTFNGLEPIAEQSDNSLITIRNTGAGVRANILRNIFKNIGKVNYPIIETLGGNSTPTFVIESNSFIDCYVNNYFRVNRSNHGFHFIVNNVFTRASVEDTINALGTTLATGFRLFINMNVFQLALNKNIVAPVLYSGYAIAQANTINHLFRYKNEDVLGNASDLARGLVNQSAVTPDSAVLPGASYTQSEVQGILTELRDLKTKLRTAGVLAP
ncbi:hypothetical protein [Sphingobacterium detergens]|uniref:Parallel beta helix pectate lyase-like protein n=1 Tax=Sphingobacterium detergens TaxID=1145106 RepID=A0A420BF45_SPHD1|nr:hypothetical protein [Sphingobacterium detergens]RKE55319.1 hypothetical protein DFQ12_0150 [Sphingobacterium detergens]